MTSRWEPKCPIAFQLLHRTPINNMIWLFDVHDMLDDQIASLSNPWTASIQFPVFVVLDMKLFSPIIFNAPPEEVDICKYPNAQQYPTKWLCFPSSKYPPPLNNAYIQ